MARHPIFAWSERFVDDYAALVPLHATFLGVEGHDHRWGDGTPEGHAERRSFLERSLAEVREMPATDDRWAGLAVRVAEDGISTVLGWYEDEEHLRDLGHVASLFPTMIDVFDVMDTSSPEGWGAVASRLERFGAALDGFRELLAEGQRRGLYAPRRQVQSVIAQMRRAAGDGGRIGQVMDDLAVSDVDDDTLERRVGQATASARSAIDELADDLERSYLPEAPDVDGVGRDRYLRHARRHLGTVIDPEETYAWGWHHLGELRDRIVRVAQLIDPERDLDGVAELLKTDPDRAAQDPETFRGVIQGMLDRAVERLEGDVVRVPDEIREIDVRVSTAGLPPGAWYQPPSEDFSRRGAAWWSFVDETHIPLYEEVSTAYHEGFPGHHLQIGTQMTVSDRLSRLHRIWYWNPGYGEGWALYAEKLMDELGFLDEPDHVFGMLTGAILRAARVVIDIGLHLDLAIPDGQPFHPGARWDFERGVEMLERYAFLDREYAESEVKRYLGLPGQAISYKLGERTILELREEVRGRDGDRFDLREFHDQVLDHGALGLDLLREVILGG